MAANGNVFVRKFSAPQFTNYVMTDGIGQHLPVCMQGNIYRTLLQILAQPVSIVQPNSYSRYFSKRIVVIGSSSMRVVVGTVRHAAHNYRLCTIFSSHAWAAATVLHSIAIRLKGSYKCWVEFIVVKNNLVFNQ